MELIIRDELSPGLIKFKKVSDKVMKVAVEKAALQFLNWIVNGSPTNSRVPPILTGALRGSGSVFVEAKLISTTGGQANTSYSGQKMVTTIGFNTVYAARLHETEWNPGPVSVQSGDVGNKWIESHLKSDGKAWLKFIATLMEKKL
jgi:hypothetical protein